MSMKIETVGRFIDDIDLEEKAQQIKRYMYDFTGSKENCILFPELRKVMEVILKYTDELERVIIKNEGNEMNYYKTGVLNVDKNSISIPAEEIYAYNKETNQNELCYLITKKNFEYLLESISKNTLNISYERK